jgi:CRISPR-associated protein Csx17
LGKNRKPELLRLCRNELPDGALAWLDAAIALGQDNDPSYSRLLGTGGNLGRQELSVTYLQQVRAALGSRYSLEWLMSALDGQQRAPLPKESPGQFDPGGVGASDEPNPVGNPWTFLFLVEGTLLFATAVVRRFGSATGGLRCRSRWRVQRQASPRRRRERFPLPNFGHRSGLSHAHP